MVREYKGVKSATAFVTNSGKCSIATISIPELSALAKDAVNAKVDSVVLCIVEGAARSINTKVGVRNIRTVYIRPSKPVQKS
jgi:hypothetical protein